jgi:hypothetical protein
VHISVLAIEGTPTVLAAPLMHKISKDMPIAHNPMHLFGDIC